MNASQDRIMAPMEAVFRATADVPEERIHGKRPGNGAIDAD